MGEAAVEVQAPAIVGEQLLKVSACAKPSVTLSVAGVYRLDDTNHGKPVYRRFSGPWGSHVVIYYWDLRDGLHLCGWWIGADVGGDTAWFHHPNRNAAMPPATGWNYSGEKEIDRMLAVERVSEEGAKLAAELQKGGGLLGRYNEVEVVEEEASDVAEGTSLVLSACKDASRRNIVAGVYHISGTNHGKPVYKKEPQPSDEYEVFIYFWGKKDGVNERGWWIGCDIGESEAWCFHPNRHAATPPKSDWNVPCSGPVDPTFSVSSQDADKESKAWSDRLEEALIKTRSCCACGMAWRSGIVGGALLYASAANDYGWDMLLRDWDYEASVVQEDFTEKKVKINEQSALHAAIDPDNSQDFLWMGGQRYTVVLRQLVERKDGRELPLIVAKRFKKGLCMVLLRATVVIAMYDEALDQSQCEMTCKRAIFKFIVEHCAEWM